MSQICFEGGVAKTLYIPYKLILIGGVANQNNFVTPPKYLRHLLTMQLKSRVKTNLRHFPTICQLYYHGHYLHAGGLSVNNYVRENKVREVNVRE